MGRVYKIMAVAILLFGSPSWAQSVIRDGKEWLQPIDFVGLSWDEVAAVCPASGGLCSGTLGGTDVTGYRWGSIDEIYALFNSYGVSPPLGPGPDFVSGFPDAVMVAFFADFAPTSDNTNERLSWGWSVDKQMPAGAFPAAYNTYIGYVFSDQVPPKSSSDVIATDFTYSGLGAWLYRVVPPESVPTMSAYGLAMTMLGLMFVAVRRLRASAKRG